MILPPLPSQSIESNNITYSCSYSYNSSCSHTEFSILFPLSIQSLESNDTNISSELKDMNCTNNEVLEENNHLYGDRIFLSQFHQLERSISNRHMLPLNDLYILICQMFSMSITIFYLYLIVVLYVVFLSYPAKLQNRYIISHILVSNLILSDNIADIDQSYLWLLSALINGMCVLLCVFLLMSLAAWLVFTGRLRLMESLIMIIFSLVMMISNSYFLYQVIYVYFLPIDTFSFIFLSLNFSICLWYGVFILHPNSFFSKLCVLFFPLCLIWSLIELPESSVWISIVLLLIFDGIVLIIPCGPLHYLIKAQSNHSLSSTRGLMYEGDFYTLGVGDLLFYGVLMGKASLRGFLPSICTFSAVITGIIMTIITSYKFNIRVIPALPFSIGFGILAYISVILFLNDFVIDMSFYSIIV